MIADGSSEGVVEVEGTGDAIFEHAKPLSRWFLKFNGAKEIRGLDDDLESIREIVGELADLFGEAGRKGLG